MSLCGKCSRNESKAMRALESLTPGGSEFVDEPERCVQAIRDTMDSRWKHLLKLTKENRDLREYKARYEGLCKGLTQFTTPSDK